MPYKKRYRSQSRNKARFKLKVARIAVNAVNKAQSGVRKYFHDDHSLSLAAPQNTPTWFCFGDQGTKTDYEACLDNTEGPQVGTTPANDPTRPVETATVESNFRYKIEKLNTKWHMKNMSPHPIHIRLYEIVCKKSLAFDTASGYMAYSVIKALIQGWEDLGGANTDAAVGSATTYSPTLGTPAYYSQCTTKHLYPTQSKHFNQWFKLGKRKKFTMQAGDDLYFTIKSGSFVYDYDKFSGVGADLEPVDLFPGKSRCVLMQVYGSLGHDTADQTKVGYMSCDMAVEKFKSYRVIQMSSRIDVSGHAAPTVDAAIGTLEGPSEKVMTNED